MGSLGLKTGLLAGCFCALLGPTSAAASTAASREIEAKVALEGALEKRLQAVIEKVLDTQDLIVIVNVEMFSDADQKTPDIMPGVPIKDNPAIPGALGLTMSMVRRVSATILVDEATSDQDLALVRKTAADILGIAPDKKDQLSVEKMKFRRLRPRSLDLAEYLRPNAVMSMLWLVMAAGLALLLYTTVYRRFLFPALRLAEQATAARMEAANRQSTETAAGPEEEEAAQPDHKPEGPQSAGNGAGPSKLPFNFIEDRHLPMLQYLLKKAEPRTAAVIMHYLPPRLASSTLAGLTPEIRREVMALMSQVVQLDEAQVRTVEDWLRARIDFMMGGEDKLAEILDQTPAGLRAELMQTLRARDKNLGERLDRKVVLLEDLALLDQAQIKALSRRVPIRSLAAVLKYSEKLKDSLMPKLSSGLGQWLAQEIQLSGDMPPDRIEAEQQRVLTALQALIREGTVVLRRGGAPPPKTNGTK